MADGSETEFFSFARIYGRTEPYCQCTRSDVTRKDSADQLHVAGGERKKKEETLRSGLNYSAAEIDIIRFDEHLIMVIREREK